MNDNPKIQKILEDELDWSVRTGKTFRYHTVIAQIEALHKDDIRQAKLDTAEYFKKYMISNSPFISEIVDPFIENLETKKGA